MKNKNRETGILGEEAAVRFLENKGFEIITRNFATKFGEIDIIFKDGEKTVFAEVKTKKGKDFGTPEEMFTRGKLSKVKRMATLYLKGEEVPCRIDMIAVEMDNSGQITDIRHYQNAGDR
jgi:putative endonuclease